MARTNDEENFGKRRFGIPSILGGLGLVGLLAGGIYLARTSSQSSMRAEDVQRVVHDTLLRTVNEQRNQWRLWLGDPKTDPKLKQEAVFQLARLRDRDSLPHFIKMLNETSNHAMIRLLAMALLEFPRADGQGAIPALREKLAKSTLEDEPQIASTLVFLRDRESFKRVFEIYKKSVMTSARAVDGTHSFDPSTLAELTDRTTFRGFASDEKPGVRQLVAEYISSQPEKEDLPTLIKLLQDNDLDVSSSAAVGVAKINHTSASKLLVEKLAAAEKEDNDAARKKYIEALKNGIGGAGLVYALKVMPAHDVDLEGRGRFVLEELRELADPSAARAYKEYLRDASNPPHYRSQVALALADIGDDEAIPFLADRVDYGGSRATTANLGWKKQPPVDADPVSFRENQTAAQDIGDLALLYPEKKAQFLNVAKPHLEAFNHWFPAPWLIVTRALAYLGDRNTLDACKKEVKSFKLPDENRTEPYAQEMLSFLTAIRFVGYASDASMIDELTRWLERPRNKQGVPYIVSQVGMEAATNQAYRLAYIDAAQAALDGLAEWGAGAVKASSKILKVIKDKDQGTFPRLMAGRAFGLVANANEIVAALREANTSHDIDTKISV